jgi:hydroxymethylpyrimidine/phosphomethylpyrimidine kinase
MPKAGRDWPVALTVAGSDPSGGAGIQADLKTFAALEVYGAAVITAVTVQNTRGVSAVHTLAAEVVEDQLDAVLFDLAPEAVKTGMLGGAAVVEAVASGLRRRPPEFLVVDPVLAAGGGEPLLEPDARGILVRELFPLATLVTPNLPEARVLTADDKSPPADLLRRVVDLGAAGVLLKGGHGKGGDVVDLLWNGERVMEFRRSRVETNCTHGTGCTLAAAVAAFLTRGRILEDAILEAGDYVHRGLETAWPLARGRGPLHHMHPFWGRP